MFRIKKRKNNTGQMIPCKIFQMFLCDRSFDCVEDLPSYKHSTKDDICCMRDAVNSFVLHNPDYDYNFYDLEGAQQYIWSLDDNLPGIDLSVYKKCFNKINSNTLKSDFFRLLLVYVEGGIYVDVDAYCRASFTSFINKDDTLVTGTGKRGEIHFGCLAYAPGNEVIRLTIQEGMNNIMTYDGEMELQNICGAPVLNRNFQALHNELSVHLSTMEYVKWKELQNSNTVKTVKRFKTSNGYFNILRGDHLGGAIKFQYPRYKNDLMTLGACYWKQDTRCIK